MVDPVTFAQMMAATYAESSEAYKEQISALRSLIPEADIKSDPNIQLSLDVLQILSTALGNASVQINGLVRRHGMKHGN